MPFQWFVASKRVTTTEISWAAKMQPLATLRQIFTYFYVHSDFDPRNKSIQIALFIIIASSVICNMAAYTYLSKHIVIDLNKSLYAVFEFAAGMICTSATVTNIISHHEIIAVLDHLKVIYDTSKPIPVFSTNTNFIRTRFLDKQKNWFRFLTQVNERCELLLKIYVKWFVFGIPIGLLLITIVATYVCSLFRGSFDSDFLFNPYKLE